MHNEAIRPTQTKKTVRFLGLDDKEVDLAAERGHVIRKIYKFRRQQEKAWIKKMAEMKERKPEALEACTAFLCYVYTLLQGGNNTEEVVKIFDLDESDFTFQLAVKADLIGADDPKQQKLRSLLESPRT